MNTFEHGAYLLLTLFDICYLEITDGFKIIFFKKSDFFARFTQIKDQYHMDKQVEKQCDGYGVKNNIFYCIKFYHRKDETDEKSADCKKCHVVFTSQTISLIDGIY